MRIAVKNISANPYRKINTYPIDTAKVEALKTSIKETDFWDNILVRKEPGNTGRYEIAYGHHRLAALRELGIEEIDIPVKNLDDATMLRIMAGENMDIYKSDPRIINETVQVAKEFIDAELARFETWDDVQHAENSMLKNICENPQGFATAKRDGSGRKIICSFLGGNWKPWKVEAALSIIRDDSVDRKAVEKFSSIDLAKNFATAVKKHNIPKEEHADLAEKIISETKNLSGEIPRAVDQYAREKVQEKTKREGGIVAREDPEIERLKTFIGQTKKAADNLCISIRDTIDQMGKLKVESMRGAGLISLKVSMSEVIDSIERLETITGVSFHI